MKKRSTRSIKWLCEELRMAIADDMKQIDQWYQFENYKQVRKIIKRMRPAQFFAPELKQALDSLEERINGLGDTGADHSSTTENEDQG
jgi:hypothetical protein